MRLIAAAFLVLALQPATPPPNTDIFLASLSNVSGALTVGQPVNATNSPGYDNQPSFTPDGRQVLFTSNRGGTQTDIYRYEIAGRTVARVTDTPESEYSPTVTPDGWCTNGIAGAGEWTSGNATVGRLVCSGSGDFVVFTWTDDEQLILVQALRSDGDWDAMNETWDAAGPES